MGAEDAKTAASGSARSRSAQAHKASTNTGQGSGSAGDVTGSGTPQFLPLWTSTSRLGNSVLFQAGAKVGLGTQTSGARLDSYSPGISLRGTSSWPTGIGVYGNATATSVPTNGVYGQIASANPYAAAVFGYAYAPTSQTFGVSGTTVSNGQYAAGVSGYAGSSTGSVIGVNGYTVSSSGTGVSGGDGAVSGYTTGVFGYVSSPSGVGVLGQNSANGGNGISGISYATTSNSDGVYGQANSAGSGAECTVTRPRLVGRPPACLASTTVRLGPESSVRIAPREGPVWSGLKHQILLASVLSEQRTVPTEWLEYSERTMVRA